MSDRVLRTILIGELSADGAMGPIKVSSYQDKSITLVASGGANFTAQVVASDIEHTEPDFDVAAGDGNEWAYAASFNKDDDVLVPGSTGVAIAANGITRLIVNEEDTAWIGVEVSGYSAGTLKAYVTAGDNE